MHFLSRSNTCRTLAVIWILTLVSPAWNTAAAADPDDVSPLDNYWYFKDYVPLAWGDTVHRDKLVVKDIDNDGRVEIASGSTNDDFLNVAEYFGGLETYQTEGMVAIRALQSIAAEDIDGDGISEIFVGFDANYEFRVFSGADLTALTEIHAFNFMDSVLTIIFEHPNSGPDRWMYLGSLSTTTIVDPTTFDIVGSFFHGAEEFNVGDVEGDEYKEIVYGSGEVYSFDGITSEFLYTYDWEYNDVVELVNIDDDPLLEIIHGSFTGPVRAYDFGDSEPLWEMPTMAYPFLVEDITGDGQVELVVIGQDSSINFVDPMTHQIFWSYPSTYTRNIDFGDTDGDGEIELVINASRIVDVATQTVEWSAEHRLYGPFEEVAIGNLDGAGDLEIVFASQTGFGDDLVSGGWLLVRNAKTHARLMESQVFLDGGGRLVEIHDVEIGDPDNDGDLEIAVLGKASNDSYIVTFDGQTMAKESEFQVTDCGGFLPQLWKQLRIGDVDNDSSNEIIGVGASSACDNTSRVWVLDGLTGATEWESEALDGSGEEVVVANMDSDPALEIAVLEADVSSITDESPSVLQDFVNVFDGITHERWISEGSKYSDLATYDLDQNGSPNEILIGTDAGVVIVLESASPATGFMERTLIPLYGSPVTGISGYQTTGGDVRLAVVNYDRLIGVDPVDGSFQWQSRPLGTPSAWGYHDSLATAPIATETGTMFLVGSTFTAHQFGGVVDQGSPALTSTNLTVDEDGGTVTVTAQRLGSAEGLLSVEYATDDRSATDGEDYTGATGFFIWADGDINDKSTLIAITDDGDPEPGEEFVFNIFNVTGGVLANPSRTTITIVDDDSSVASFSAATAAVDETTATVSLDIGRTGDLSFAGSVMWATVDGSAVAGEDYTGASGTINWAVGNGDPETIVITILDDALYENDESFTVELSNPGGNTVLGDPAEAVVTIASEDIIEIVFSAAVFTGGEGSGNAAITASRTGASNGAVTADFATADDTAVAGSDYTAITGTLSWTDGDTAQKIFQVPILEDVLVELEEAVLLALDNPTGGATIGTLDTAELTIEDNDGSLLQFTEASYTIDENGGSIEIAVERFGSDTSGVVGIAYATADDTAIAGLDYVSTSGTLTWAAGDSTDKTFSVPVIDDGLLEGTESFGLDLSDPTGAGALGDPIIATVTVIDDEGTEIQINTETDQPQTRPDLAMAPDGRSVAVWESYLQDGSGWGIFGQRFNTDGSRSGAEFQVNAGAGGDQRKAAAAMGPDGSFWVIWRGPDASGGGIWGRRFNALGAPLSGDIAINTVIANDQDEPDIAIDGSGSALVVWQTDADGHLDNRGQVFGSNGAPLGGEIAINATTAGDQQLPTVAASSGGGFVVAWQSFGQDGPAEGIIARRFAASGAPLGAEVIVNAWTSGDQISPAVGQTADGSFLVAWEDTTHQDGSGSSIRARWFDTAATPQGGDIQVNTYWLDDQMNPQVACTGPGDAFIAWESADQDGSGLGIFAQTMRHDGQLTGHELQANAYITGVQYRPSIADSGAGTFWVTWASAVQDGSGDGIFGIFGELPEAPEIFVDGFESGNTSAWGATTP